MNRLLLFAVLSSCGLPSVAPEVFVQRPRATTPIEVCWLETGGRDAAAGLGAAGPVTADRWHVTISALLVRHPKGDVLIDTGLSEDLERDANELSGWGRFLFRQTAGSNAPRGSLVAQLAALGARPMGVVLSHAHADHAGGLEALADVPVWVAREELDFARANLEHGPVVVPGQARAIVARGQAIPFEATRWATYPRSWDVFGDGTLVVVPTFGHTPGSVSTFIDLGEVRVFHVGDLVNLRESISRAVPKSGVMRALTDEDSHQTDEEVARLVELQKTAPALWILPAHDRDAWRGLFGQTPTGTEPVCVKSGFGRGASGDPH